jgi:RHS repeat-associated protein
LYGITDSIGNYITGNKNGQGLLWSESGGIHQTSKEFDPDAGLTYFNNRWYDNLSGRWITKEPLGIDGPNPYHFNFNDPVNGYDPNGLWNISNPFTWGDPNSVDDTFWDSMNPFGSGGAAEGFSETFLGLNSTTARMQSGFFNLDWGEIAEGTLWAQMDEVDPCHESYGRAVINTALAFSAAAVTTAIVANAYGVGNYIVQWRGGEIRFVDPNRIIEPVRFRFSPTGHKAKPGKSNPGYRRAPHYHRRPGIGKHRPWEK